MRTLILSIKTPFITAVFLTGFSFAFNVHAQDITTGLIGHWKFDEGSGTTANDSSGNNNTGTLVNNPAWTTGNTSRSLGNALSFDGTNDSVSLNTLDVSGSALTIAGWINSTNFTNCSSADCRIISKATGTAEPDHYWMLSTISSGGTKLRFRLKTNGTTNTLISSSGNLTTNTWYHVTATYNGSMMKLYLDGIEVGSTAKTGTLTTNNTVQAWIGDNPPTQGSRPWSGILDDIRIYNRALTQQDVTALYNYTGIPDTEAPTTPTNLSASTISSTQINLSWTASTDNVGIAGYRIYRCTGSSCSPASQVSTVTGQLSYSDTGLTASTAYTYAVSAYDASGNESAKSTPKTATTQNPPPPDTTSPTMPTNLTATAQSSNQINLSWTASTDNVGVTQYRVERCTGSSCTNFTQIATPTGTTHNDTGLSANTTYRYRVRAADGAGNVSGYSSIASDTTLQQTGASFEDRCNAPGVTLCTGFDTPADIDTFALPGDNGIIVPIYDASVKASGHGSMQFIIPPYSGSNSSGSWRHPFGQAFGENSTFYVQYRLRVSPEMLTNYFGNTAWKQSIFYDTTGKTCASVEITTQNNNNQGFPILYDRCGQAFRKYYGSGGGDYYHQWTENYPIRLSGDVLCQYSKENPIDCYFYKAAQWMTFYYKVHIGTWNQPNSYVKAYVANEGEPLRQFINHDPWTAYPDKPSSTYSSLVLTPYMTGKDSSLDHPTAYTWYDELIVSTQPIADPYGSGSTPDTTSPSTPTNLTATAISSSQINLSWTASTDNVGVTQYRVERCQGSSCTNYTQIATPTGTTYNDTGLSANTTYRYRARAADGAGNVSGYSSVVSGTTQTSQPLVGDLNLDGTVNNVDWSIMSAVWFTADPTADLNKDGIVNSIDFSLMNGNWGRSI